MRAEVKSVIHLRKKYFWLDFFLPEPTSLQTLKLYALHLHQYANNWKREGLLPYFSRKPITWTHYTIPPHRLQVLPPSALLTTTPMGFRYYHLQPYYYPHGLQVLPPSALQTTTPLGFRYYHLQPHNPCSYSSSQRFIFVGFSFCSIVGQCNFFCGREDHGHSTRGQALSSNKDFPAF